MTFTDVLLLILICIVAFQGLFIIGIFGGLNKLEGMITIMMSMVGYDEQDSGDD